MPMTHFLESWGYLAVFVLSFVSAMGIPVGAELALVYGGVLASGQIAGEPHHLSLVVVIVVGTLGEVLGSLAGYLIGYFGGRALVDKIGKYVLLTHRDLDRAEAWFARHGEPLVFFGRFVPLLRSFVSFAAGIGEMAMAKFLTFTVLACATLVHRVGEPRVLARRELRARTEGVQLRRVCGVGARVIAVALLFFHRLRVVREERATGVSRTRRSDP